MSLTDTFFGTPPQTTIHTTPAMRPPGYGFSQQFFNFLPSLANRPYPTYQGQIDPGLSPTMQEAIRRSQGYAQSSPNEILQGVQGSIGRFMNPNFLNPFNQLFGGSSNWFGVNPNQSIFGGRPAGSMTYQQGVWPQLGPQPQVNAPQMSAPMTYQQPFAQTSASAPGPWGQLLGRSPQTESEIVAESTRRYGPRWRNRGFMHVTDHEAALRQLLGRDPTFWEAQDSWQLGGDRIPTLARASYRDEMRRAGMESDNSRLSQLIDQYGSISRGSRAYDEEMAAQGIR